MVTSKTNLVAVNSTPVRFEFVFNSNDSLKTKITNTEINKYELKLTTIRKTAEKRKEKRDYLQDLYGTPELTTTEYI